MDTSLTPTENNCEKNDNETQEQDVNMARLEAMVTPEQVRSANVAKKRRQFTKKRSSSASKRESTPVRIINDDKTTTTSDEDIPEQKPRHKPKTPERRRRRINKSVSKQKQNETKSEPEFIEHDPEFLPVPSKDFNRSSSIPKQFTEEAKKLSDFAQSEVVALFNKTKKSLTAAAHRGRERFRRTDKEQVKRSQSAPHEFTQEELIESFRKAQLLTVEDYTPRQRKYSDSSLRSITPDVPYEPKPFRPEVQEFVRQRRQQRQYSNKIVEILDPKTSTIIATKTIIKSPNFKLKDLFKTIRMFSLLEIYRNYKLYKIEMRHEYQQIRILWNRCMCELFVIMIFCGLGGILFKFVEGSFENFYKCGVKRVKRDFIDLLWTRSHNLREEDWKSLARTKLRVFEEELHAAHEAGMTSYSGQRSWSFLNGIVYALTIITTIGYGHLYPTTMTGRVLTIIYSIIGIPLFLIALTDFGKLFTRGIKFLWSFVRRLYYTGSCRQVRKTAHVQEIFKGAQMMYEIATFRRPSMFVDPENPHIPTNPNTPATTIGDDTPTTPAISNYEINDEFNLPISVAIFILLVYIFLGALIYCMWEHWDFFASFYFVFISMSTIGFGDYVPRHPICMIVSIVYLVFGLALMSMCINVVQVKLSDTFKHASAKIGATIGLKVSEDDGSISTVPPENVEIPEVHEGQHDNDNNDNEDKSPKEIEWKDTLKVS